jgi:dihydrofolate reductase
VLALIENKIVLKKKTMRKLIVIEFITLDGVVQAPGGPKEDPSGGFQYGGWTVPYFDDELLNSVMAEQMKGPFELLLGRITYEIFSAYWPDHSENWPGINEAKKYVATRTDMKIEWENSILLNENVVEKIKKLKAKTGPDLKVWGSGKLVQTLLKNDLVDELWLKIFPITLGKGKRLFAEGTLPLLPLDCMIQKSRQKELSSLPTNAPEQ